MDLKTLKGAVAAFSIIALFGAFLYFAFIPWYFSIREPYFSMPLRPAADGKLHIRSDDYGEGYFGAKRKNGRLHLGTDILSAKGNPVYASKSGWAKALYYPKGYGNLVVITHPGGWQTRYGHLDSIAIRKSQWVWQGNLIGTVGKTGNADVEGMEPHLHFEIRHKGKALNPENFLLTKQGG